MNFDWSKISILIVDDDSDLRETLCDIFSRLGVEIYSAVNGADALGWLEKSKISLVISDLQMPVMDGAALLKNIHDRHIDVPFVFITGQSHFTEAKAAALGAKGLIYKPYTLQGLTEKIKNVLVSARLAIA